MIRNWYKLTPEQLENRVTKLSELYMNMKPDHPKRPSVWKAIDEICEVQQVLTIAKDDAFINLVVEELCL